MAQWHLTVDGHADLGPSGPVIPPAGAWPRPADRPRKVALFPNTHECGRGERLVMEPYKTGLAIL